MGNRTKFSAYKFSVDPTNSNDISRLEKFREEISQMNKMAKSVGLSTKSYVKCQGRWGKNNPAIDKRRRLSRHSMYNIYQTCPLKDAVKWDVYVYNRY